MRVRKRGLAVARFLTLAGPMLVAGGTVFAGSLAVERFAAEEFRRYAGDFHIVFEEREVSGGEEAFRLSETNGMLWIVGKGRGRLYGVYEALERFWGIRWCASDFTFVPKREKVMIPAGFVLEDRPAFLLRNGYFYDAKESPDFAAHLRFNGDFHDLDERHGGTALRFGKGLAHHTLNRLLPVSRYGKEHPEYYCMRNGLRQTAKDGMYKLQVCLTNPDVLKIVTENLLAEIANDPTAIRYAVSQNDNLNFCQCPACAAVDAEEGSHAGTLIRFVNAVAAEIEKRYPDKYVQTSAYQYTRKPPKTAPRHNVLIGLCPIECDCSRPLASVGSPKNEAFRQDLQGWLRLAGNVAVFNYVTQFSGYHMPFANLRALGADMRYYRDVGVRMITNEGLYNGHGADLEALRCYLAAKLMWNPDLDQDAVAEDFCRAYYGAAAAPVLEYYRKLKSLPSKDGYALDCCFSTYAHREIVTDAFLDEALNLWNEAEELAWRDSPSTLTNVLKGAFPVRFTRFRRLNDTYAPVPYSLRRSCAALDDGTAEYRMLACRLRDSYPRIWPQLRYWEERGADKRAEEMKALVLRASSYEPPSGTESFRVDSSQLEVCMIGRDVDFVDDAGAVGGRALRFRNEGWNWNAQLPLPASVFDIGERYRLRLRLKLEKTPGGEEGPVVEAGFFNKAQRKEFGAMKKCASELEDGVWQWVDFGTFQPTDSQFLWIMAGRFDRQRFVRNPAMNGVRLDQLEISRVDLK